MNDFLIAYKGELVNMLVFLYVPFVAFIVALSAVYLLGRMFSIVRTDSQKNTVACLTMIAVYIYHYFKLEGAMSPEVRLWNLVVYSAVSILLYVLLGFRLYDRVDSFLDRHVGADKSHNPRKKK